MRKLIMTLAAALLMTASAHAADSPAGKWTGETQGRNGPQTISLELKASGGTLTGSMANGDNPAVDIEDGTVSGAKFTFGMTRNIQGNEIKIKYAGEAKGDDLTMTRELVLPAGAPAGSAPAPVTMTLKRAK